MPKKNRNAAEHQRATQIGAQQHANKASYGGSGDGFGQPKKANCGRRSGGFGAPPPANRTNYADAEGFDASRAAPAAWGGAGTNTAPEEPYLIYNSVDDEPICYAGAAGPAVKDAPPPKENVWQQRMDFYQGAVPSSLDEEERMLQAALEISRIEVEKQKLLRKLEEEELAAETNPKIEEGSKTQTETVADEQSLYAYNGAVPPPKAGILHVGKQDVSPPKDAWPSPVSVVPPSSACQTKACEAGLKKAREPCFQRAMGRGNRSSQSMSGSADVNCLTKVGKVESKCSSRTEPKSLPHQLQLQYKHLLQHKPQPDIIEPQSVWTFDSCEVSPEMDYAESRAPEEGGVIASNSPSMMEMEQRKVVSENNDIATSDTDQDQVIAIHPKSEASMISFGHSNPSQAVLTTNNAATLTVNTSSEFQNLEPAISGMPSNSAKEGTRVIRRQYGPRARVRKPITVANNLKTSSIPMTTSDLCIQTTLKTSIPDTQVFKEDDTSSKLVELCTIAQKSQPENTHQKNSYDNIAVSRLNYTSKTETICDSTSLMQSLVSSTEFSSSTLPNTTGSLDLGKQAAPTTSALNSFPSLNSIDKNNQVDDLHSKLGGLGLSGDVWSQQLMNVQSPWITNSPEGDKITSSAQQLSRASSESSDLSPNRSPCLPEDTQDEKKDIPYNPVGSYMSPLMNMYMPQIYGLGYLGLPIASGVGLGNPTLLCKDGNPRVPQQNTNFQMPGMMPFGMLPGLMPMCMPPVPSHGMNRNGMPAVAGQGPSDVTQESVSADAGKDMPVMPGQGMPMSGHGMLAYDLQGMSGQGMPGMPGYIMQDMPAMSGKGVPIMHGKDMACHSEQSFPDVPEQSTSVIPHQSMAAMSEKSLPPMPGNGMPPMPGKGMPGNGMSPLPVQGMPPLQGKGVSPMPGQAMSPMPGQGMPHMPVQGMPVQGMPPMPGQAILPMPGQAILPMSGQGMPPMPGQGMPPMPGQGMSPMPGQGMPFMPGQGMPSMPGQGMPPMPGQGMPPMPGQGMPPMPGQGMPTMPGQGMHPMPGQGMPHMLGQGMPPMPAQRMPPMPGHGLPVMSGHGTSVMSGSGLPRIPDQCMPPGQGMPSSPWQCMPPTPGPGISPTLGQSMSPMSRLGVLNMPEHEIQCLIAKTTPNMSCQQVTNMSSQAVPAQMRPCRSGQAMSGMSGIQCDNISSNIAVPEQSTMHVEHGSRTQSNSKPWEKNAKLNGGSAQYRLPFGNFSSSAPASTPGEQCHGLSKGGIGMPLQPQQYNGAGYAAHQMRSNRISQSNVNDVD